jgi:hypothetical protein
VFTQYADGCAHGVLDKVQTRVPVKKKFEKGFAVRMQTLEVAYTGAASASLVGNWREAGSPMLPLGGGVRLMVVKNTGLE